MSRTGPCCRCGRSINWLDQYCIPCERAMSDLEELEEERREKVEGILGMAAREGWCSLGDCVFCAVHAPEGAEPVKVADYEDTITDVVDASYLTLECEHEDGCDCMGEWDLPTVPEPEEDWRY